MLPHKVFIRSDYSALIFSSAVTSPSSPGRHRVSPDPGYTAHARHSVTAQAHWLSGLSCVCDVRVITRELSSSEATVTVLTTTTSQHISTAGDIKVGHIYLGLWIFCSCQESVFGSLNFEKCNHILNENEIIIHHKFYAAISVNTDCSVTVAADC